MSSRKSIRLELDVDQHQDQILAGLNAWLELGLISHERVRLICRYTFVCDYSPQQLRDRIKRLRAQPATTLPAPPVQRDRENAAPPASAAPTPALNVIWLLAIGVALVLLSSGILAIALWQLVPIELQYLILVAYTVGFGVAGRGAATKPKLLLTARALRNLTLWLAPIHVWMIQGWLWSGGSTAQLIGIAAAAIGVVWLKKSRLSWLDLALTFTPALGVEAGLTAAIAIALIQIAAQRSPWRWLDPALYSLVALSVPLLRFAVLGVGQDSGQVMLAWALVAWGGLAMQVVGVWVGALPLAIGALLALLHSPLSAWGMSLAAAAVLCDRLRLHWRLLDGWLLALTGAAFTFLSWQVLPAAALTEALSPMPTVALQGYPYAIALTGAGLVFWRLQKQAFAQGAARLAVIWAIGMIGLSWPSPLLRFALLAISALVAVTVVAAAKLNVNLVPIAIAGWAATNAGLLLAPFSRLEWMLLLMLQGIALWSWYNRSRWRRPGWVVGWLSVGLAYALAWGSAFLPGLRVLLFAVNAADTTLVGIAPESWVLVAVPIALAGLSAVRRGEVRATLAWWSVVSLMALLPLTVANANGRLVVLISGLVLLAWLTARTPQVALALLTWGFGLGSLTAIAIRVIESFTTFENTVLVLAIAPAVCIPFARREWGSPLIKVYAIAARYWTQITAISCLLLLSVAGSSLALGWQDPSLLLVLVSGLNNATLGWLSWRQAVWGWPWAIAGVVSGWFIDAYWPTLFPSFGLYLLTLALIVQLVGDLQRSPNLPLVWHVVPLVYASLGWFGSLNLSQLSGVTLAAAWPWLSIGRRRWPFAGCVGMVGVSAAVLLVIDEVGAAYWQSDTWLPLALVAIALHYQWQAQNLATATRIPPPWLQKLSYGHWGLASLFLVAALIINEPNDVLMLLAAVGLAAFAIAERRASWVDAGLLWAIGALYFGLRLAELSRYTSWNLTLVATLATGLAIIYIPSLSPAWRRFAGLYPLLLGIIAWPYLQLVTAAYYIVLAMRQMRWLYASLFLVDSAILRLVDRIPLGISGLLIGANLIAIASIEPKISQSRQSLHQLRLAALTLCLAAIALEWNLLIMGGISVAFLVWGLWQQTRAFAIVGSAGFAIAVLQQSSRWLSSDPILLWAGGIAIGIGLIVVAAQFESQRDRWQSQWRTWQEQWQTWR